MALEDYSVPDILGLTGLNRRYLDQVKAIQDRLEAGLPQSLRTVDSISQQLAGIGHATSAIDQQMQRSQEWIEGITSASSLMRVNAQRISEQFGADLERFRWMSESVLGNWQRRNEDIRSLMNAVQASDSMFERTSAIASHATCIAGQLRFELPDSLFKSIEEATALRDIEAIVETFEHGFPRQSSDDPSRRNHSLNWQEAHALALQYLMLLLAILSFVTGPASSQLEDIAGSLDAMEAGHVGSHQASRSQISSGSSSKYAATTHVRLRSGPGRSNNVVRMLDDGSMFFVTERSGDWYGGYVEQAGASKQWGWVYRKFLIRVREASVDSTEQKALDQ